MPKLSHLVAAVAVALVIVVLPAGAGASAATPGNEPRMHFDGRMRVQPVCFGVTNPRGTASTLYGQRYTDGPVSGRTPAIVLVHGIASSTANWDFSPTWSTARALASAGYVVYSYDRLGYARSPYFDLPGNGFTLTTREHRRMLHEVVDDVKSGSYSTTSGADCSGAKVPGGLSNRTVVVVGHSAGGWIVAGYPGTYHDVAAMIQTDITGSSAQGDGSDGGSKGGGFTPDPEHPDYFQFFQQRQDCEDFNVDQAGAVRSVVDIACTPPFLDSPFGEIADIGAMYAENDAAISQIGPGTPVLLTSGDHDTTAPPSAARADLAYYKAHCGCDVSQILLPDTGHLFQVHRSLAPWVNDVVAWLGKHGLGTGRKPVTAADRKRFAGLSIRRGQRIEVSSRGAARVRASCPRSAVGRCNGTLTLVRGTRARVLGRARFSVRRGRSATISVRLSRAARRALAGHGSLQATARARSRDGAGRVGTTSRRLTLTAPS